MRKIFMAFLIVLLVLVLAAPGYAGNQGGTFTLDPFTGIYTFERLLATCPCERCRQG